MTHKHPRVSLLARQILWLLMVVSFILFRSLNLCRNTRMNSLKRKGDSRQLLWYILFYNYFSWPINFGAAQNGQFINYRYTNLPAHLKWEPSRVGAHWTIIGPIIKREAELPFSNLTDDLQRARSRAFFIPITTSENERFLRTYHHSLKPHQTVYRIKDVRGHKMWTISFEWSAPVHDIYAAGLPIHILPSFIVPPRAPQQRLEWSNHWSNKPARDSSL